MLRTSKSLDEAAPKGDEPIGLLEGLPVYAKSGRYGPYVQWGTPD